jgi:hypothetical protein
LEEIKIETSLVTFQPKNGGGEADHSFNKSNGSKSQRVLDTNLARLEVEVVDGEKQIIGTQVLKFNAWGLENVKPLRNAYDGVTHFGCKRF